MSTDKLLSLYILAQRNLDLAPASEANLTTVNSTVRKPDGVIATDEVLLLIPVCHVIVLAIFILMLLDVWKVARVEIATLNPFRQFPCKNCRFFTNDHHLLCAVHPSAALTKQAFDCSDYHPLIEDLS